MKNGIKTLAMWLILGIILMVVLVSIIDSSEGKLTYSDLLMKIENGEVFIYGMHISPYEKGNIFNKDPLRERKLLMHRYEINKLKGKIQEKGYALVPLQVYFKGSLVKVEIGLARGKKLYDKREVAAKKDAQRDIERNLRR